MGKDIDMIQMRRPDTCKPLHDLIVYTSLPKITMVEVGSYAGESADTFASMPQVQEIWCVDPWSPGYDDVGDPASKSDFSEVEAAFDKVMEMHKDKIRKFKGTFREFAKSRPGVRPDLVYIDGCHQYDSVKDDIAAAIASGATFICGHDHNWPGVGRAVAEAFGRPLRVLSDTSWICTINMNKSKEIGDAYMSRLRQERAVRSGI